MGFPVISKEGDRFQQVGMLTQSFRFRVNGTSDPDDIIDPNGNVTSITYAATGVFTVTLDPAFRPQQLVDWKVSVEFNAAAAFAGYVDVDSYDRDAGTFTVSTYAVAVATVPTDNTIIGVTIVGQMQRSLVI